MGLSTTQLRTAIEANNRNDGAGRLREGDEVLLVRSGAHQDHGRSCAIVVKAEGGASVRVADVRPGAREGYPTRYGVVTQRAWRGVEGLVLLGWPAPTRTGGRRRDAKLEELAPPAAGGVEIKVFYNRAISGGDGGGHRV